MNECEYMISEIKRKPHKYMIIRRTPGKTYYLKEEGRWGNDRVWAKASSKALVYDDIILATMVKKTLEYTDCYSTFFGITEAHAEYTGGSCWIFYGKLSTGDWFLADDFKDGICIVVSEDPSKDWDNCTYEEWQTKHLVREINDKEQHHFRMMLIETLKKDPERYITDEELTVMKSAW